MIPVIIALVMVSICWFIIGYGIGIERKKPIRIEEVKEYVKITFPDLWAAYTKGVHEGYEQGLRDGQTLDHEST